MAKNQNVGSTGLDENVASTLAYSIGLITGILFLIVEKDNKTVRFHAFQSILANLVAVVVNWLLVLSFVGIILVPFWGIVVFVYWVLLMIRTYKGINWELPILGKYAKEFSKR